MLMCLLEQVIKQDLYQIALKSFKRLVWPRERKTKMVLLTTKRLTVVFKSI